MCGLDLRPWQGSFARHFTPKVLRGTQDMGTGELFGQPDSMLGSNL